VPPPVASNFAESLPRATPPKPTDVEHLEWVAPPDCQLNATPFKDSAQTFDRVITAITLSRKRSRELARTDSVGIVRFGTTHPDVAYASVAAIYHGG
jgi:hypothetical protein